MPNFRKRIGLQDGNNIFPNASIYERIAKHVGNRYRKIPDKYSKKRLIIQQLGDHLGNAAAAGLVLKVPDPSFR